MASVFQRTPPAGSVRLLRYRFDHVGQVARHFHVASGRVLLFYPGLLTLRPGEPVLLNVTFRSSEQHCPIRGSVLGKDGGGQHAGWWLEFSAHGLVGSLHGATASPKRRMQRFPSDLVVSVERPEGMPVIAKLVDVGLGGGRMAGASIRVAVGDKLRLSMFSRQMGGPVLAACVAWVRAPEVGLDFRKPSPRERATIAALVDHARQQLGDAYEAIHPGFCHCLEGNAVAEPPLPRAAHRQIGSL